MNSKLLAIAAFIFAVSACQQEANKPQATADTPYAVGSRTIFIHDESRSYDSVVGIDTGVRTLITEIWYPVEHDAIDSDAHRKATYGDYVFGDRRMHHRMMTQTTFFHLTPQTVRDGVTADQMDAAIDELYSRERVSYVDAPLASTDDGWPASS